MKLACMVAAVLFTLASIAEAAPNCKKGKPCGGACIAQDKTCRK